MTCPDCHEDIESDLCECYCPECDEAGCGGDCIFDEEVSA